MSLLPYHRQDLSRYNSPRSIGFPRSSAYTALASVGAQGAINLYKNLSSNFYTEIPRSQRRRMPKRYRRPERYRRRTKRARRSGTSRSNVGQYRRFTAPGKLGPDLKYINLTSATATTLGSVTPKLVKWGLGADGSAGAATHSSLVDQIAVGSGAQQRSNQKIVITSIQVNGTINGTTNNDAQIGSLWLVLDTQCNGEVMDPTDLWHTQTSAGSNLALLRNLGNSQRFKILKTFDFDLTNKTIGGQEKRHFKYYQKVNIPVEYSPTASGAGAITDLKSNNLSFFIQTADNQNVVFHVQARLRFRDR